MISSEVLSLIKDLNLYEKKLEKRMREAVTGELSVSPSSQNKPQKTS